MTNDTNIVDAALEVYVARATPDPEWIALLRESARQLLEGLAVAERERLVGYLNQYSILNASFIMQRVAAVHASSLFSQGSGEHGGEGTVAENLAAFRRDFVDPPAGEEEGKRPGEIPLVVYKAALRRIQGCDAGTPQAFWDMTAESIKKVMATFSTEERARTEEQFETFSVEAMAHVFRLWMWHQGEESKRFVTPRQQYDQWHATGDESYWWRYPQGEEWIYF